MKKKISMERTSPRSTVSWSKARRSSRASPLNCPSPLSPGATSNTSGFNSYNTHESSDSEKGVVQNNPTDRLQKAIKGFAKKATVAMDEKSAFM